MASRRNNKRSNKNDDHGYYGNNKSNFDSRLNLNNDASSSSSQNYNNNNNNNNNNTKKKFIGGAERARQEARKRQWEPKNTHHQEYGNNNNNNNKKKKNKKQQNNVHDNNNNIDDDSSSRVMNNILSNRKLRPSERFYAALLQPTNFFNDDNKNNRKIILQRICLGLGLGLPPSEYNTPGVISHTDNIRTFFTSRAILVMEESRYTLTEALVKKTDRRKNTSSQRQKEDGTGWMNVKLVDICEQKRTKFFVLEFEKDINTTAIALKRFTTKELSNQRPGCCYEIEIDNKTDSKNNTIIYAKNKNNDTGSSSSTSSSSIKLLGSVLPSGKRDASKLILVVYDNEGIYQLQQMIGLAAEAQSQSKILKLSEDDKDQSTITATSSSSSSSSILQSISFRLRFCTTLISNCRQFEACDYGCSKKHKSGSSNSLLNKIMGQKESTHIRFNYSDDDNDKSDVDKKDNDKSDNDNDKKDKTNNKDDDDSDDDSDDSDSDSEEEDDEIIISHIDGNIGNENNDPNNNSKIDDNNSNSKSLRNIRPKLKLQGKKLNPIQEKAAIDFVNSKDGSLKLIQGPPGTGKTTFVVSVLAKLLMNDNDNDNGDGRSMRRRRILVTAPTNKAVGVIAKRFLESYPNILDGSGDSDSGGSGSGSGNGIPIVLIGVEDKLLENNDKNDNSELSFVDSQLKRIFCYTWVSSLADDYTDLLKFISTNNKNTNGSNKNINNRGVCSWLPKVYPLPSNNNNKDGDNSDSNTIITESIRIKAWSLHTRLVKNLPQLSKKSGLVKLSQKLLRYLRVVVADEDDYDEENDENKDSKQQQQENVSEARFCLRQLIAILRNDDSTNNGTGLSSGGGDSRDSPSLEVLAVPELLYSAQIVFSTLSTCGTSLMKQTKRFDDWIVDEAAATTEPELLIPLHLRPRRLLAVGDPMQLPAMVSSPYAIKCGLSRSLHERLTEDLNHSQTMLNIQYRMKPDISLFPSNQFYNGKVTNGNNVQQNGYGLGLSSSSSSSLRTSNKGGIVGQQLLESTPPWCFFQVNGKERQSSSGSYCNIDEASAVIAFLRIIRKRWYHQQKQQQQQQQSKAVSTAASSSSSEWCTSDKIRIITFYSAQVATLKQMLHKEGGGMSNVLVATVDSSQGCEADIVILSFVRTSNNAGFLKDNRRMNVALTRAKYKLICLGNIRGFYNNFQSSKSSSSSLSSPWATTTNSSTATTATTTNYTGGGGTLKKMIDDATQRGCVSYVLDGEN